ncbi:MAG TPA: FAD-dependent thymidylate synthase [Acidobacteriaceae bacterium]|nr:FAD-dependent thymidylate synthase [Acidobacteriaceae bacterium]
MPPTESQTEVAPLPNSPATETAERPRNQTDVYAVHGADPEVLAYAMAKYSRSSLSMKESLREISSQRAEQFLNTFYFQYGHRSIADLAHVAFAIERLSLLAAIILVDEQRWDGQERSTRYQNFRKSGWYLPEFGDADAARAARATYEATIERLFAEYHVVSEGVLASLMAKTERPAEMKPETFERTLRARAFDVARYLLPLATNTSLGQIVNARTLEMQVSRLLSDEHAEVRELGDRLRAAGTGPAWNVHAREMTKLVAELRGTHPELANHAAALLEREVKVAPTLVKYAAANPYQQQTRRELEQAARELMGDAAIDPAPLVDLVERGPSLEVEITATLLYGVCHYPFRQVRDRVAALSEAQRVELIDLGVRHRGGHDDVVRGFAAGPPLRFDILMDIGGFRDMHRHRRCLQTLQSFTPAHGFDVPEGLAEAGLVSTYEAATTAAHEAFAVVAASDGPEAAATARYLLPLGTRCRSLFQMDFAEALYISELRSAPQGHFSYRRVAWEMYQAVERQHPALARHMRVTDVREPVDLLKR